MKKLLTRKHYGAIIQKLLEANTLLTYIDGQTRRQIVGIDCREGPPVPIPNTEVKLMYADDSCRVTGRENR